MRNSLEQTKLVKQQVDLWHAQSTLRVPPLCRRGTTSMKDVLSFRHGSDEELEEENTACHENERPTRRRGRPAPAAATAKRTAPISPSSGERPCLFPLFLDLVFPEKQDSEISLLSEESAI